MERSTPIQASENQKDQIMGMAFIGVLAILFGGSSGGGRGPDLGVIIAFFVCCALIYGFFALPLMLGQWLVDSGFQYGLWVAPAIWVACLALNYVMAIRDEKRRALSR